MTPDGSGPADTARSPGVENTPASDTADSDGTGASARDPTEHPDRAARVEALEAENRRLRTEYARAQHSKYRQTAYGLGLVGLLAALGGLLFPDSREVLFVLAGTGLFGGVLTLSLTPGRFVTAEVGERVYAALAANERAVASELGLSETYLYVPGTDRSARLYVPQDPEFEIPDTTDGPVVVSEGQRGLLLEATGSYLFEEFERASAGGLAETPTALAAQLADGVVEQFELAAAVEPDVDAANAQATIRVSESAFGALDRVDHPVVSFFAAGLAVGLERPVSVDVSTGDTRADWVFVLRWQDSQ